MDDTAISAAEKVLGYKGCKVCPAGYYCPDEGMTVPIMCGVGFYSDVKKTECSLCPFNSYCDDMATTPSTIKPCPDGYICPEGLGVKPYAPNHACPTGYYC
jgi:hypothetical protein